MSYLIFDVETGGLNPEIHALCSIACIELDENLNEMRRYYTIVHEPERVIEDVALQVNGLTREEISKGRPIEKVVNDLKLIFKPDRIPVAHNARFDIGFLKVRGIEIDMAIDTMMVARKLFPKQRNNLTDLCKRLNIEVIDTHNSLGDVLLTAEALRKMSQTQWLDALTPRPIGQKL